MKLRPRYTEGELSQIQLTQPNQAFTPRQILEQFARHEIVPSFNKSSDLLDEDHFSENDLLSDNVIEFDDDIEAEGHLIENQYRLYEKDKGHDSFSGDSSEDSGTEDKGGKLPD